MSIRGHVIPGVPACPLIDTSHWLFFTQISEPKPFQSEWPLPPPPPPLILIHTRKHRTGWFVPRWQASTWLWLLSTYIFYLDCEVPSLVNSHWEAWLPAPCTYMTKTMFTLKKRNSVWIIFFPDLRSTYVNMWPIVMLQRCYLCHIIISNSLRMRSAHKHDQNTYLDLFVWNCPIKHILCISISGF